MGRPAGSAGYNVGLANGIGQGREGDARLYVWSDVVSARSVSDFFTLMLLKGPISGLWANAPAATLRSPLRSYRHPKTLIISSHPCFPHLSAPSALDWRNSSLQSWASSSSSQRAVRLSNAH